MLNGVKMCHTERDQPVASMARIVVFTCITNIQSEANMQYVLAKQFVHIIQAIKVK